jgi:hypothetical protein
MGVQWDSTSGIYRLTESLWFSEEGSSVNILIEVGVPMKSFRLIKMCLNECIAKFIYDSTQSGLKQGDSLLPLLFNFALQYTIKKVQEIQEGLKSAHLCW